MRHGFQVGLKTAALALAVSGLLLAGCSRLGKAESVPNRAAEPSFMLVFQAQRGSLSPDANKPGAYTLTLRDTDSTAVFFSDRPKRLVGNLPVSLLAHNWSAMGFDTDAPVAAAVVNAGTESQQTLVLELNKPVWDGATNTLSFSAVQGANLDVDPLTFSGQQSTAQLPATFSSIDVYLDPSQHLGLEFMVTEPGVVNLRKAYDSKDMGRSIDVLPRILYVGPDYFGPEGAAGPTPTPEPAKKATVRR